MGAHLLRNLCWFLFSYGLCIGAMELSTHSPHLNICIPSQGVVPSFSPAPPCLLWTWSNKRLHLRLLSLSLCVYLFISMSLSIHHLLAMKNTTLTTRDGWCFLFYLPFFPGLFFYFYFSQCTFLCLVFIRNRMSKGDRVNKFCTTRDEFESN